MVVMLTCLASSVKVIDQRAREHAGGLFNARCTCCLLALQEVCGTLPIPFIDLKEESTYCISPLLTNELPGYGGAEEVQPGFVTRWSSLVRADLLAFHLVPFIPARAATSGTRALCTDRLLHHKHRPQTHRLSMPDALTADGKDGLTSDARLGKCSGLHTQQCGIQSWGRAHKCARFMVEHLENRVLSAGEWGEVVAVSTRSRRWHLCLVWWLTTVCPHVVALIGV